MLGGAPGTYLVGSLVCGCGCGVEDTPRSVGTSGLIHGTRNGVDLVLLCSEAVLARERGPGIHTGSGSRLLNEKTCGLFCVV